MNKVYEKKAWEYVHIVGLRVPKQATVVQKSDPWAPQNHHSQWDRVVGVLASRLPTSLQNPLHSFLEYDYIQILIPKQIIKDF